MSYHDQQMSLGRRVETCVAMALVIPILAGAFVYECYWQLRYRGKPPQRRHYC